MRTGPLDDCHVGSGVTWSTREEMPMAARFNAADAERRDIAGIADVSHRRRLGLKGPLAMNWLAQRGVDVPPRGNAWGRLGDSTTVLRLGRSEFLIEESNGSRLGRILSDALPGAVGVVPVPRYDAALILTGDRIREVLLQTCAFDFDGVAPGSQTVVMTSMVGIGVTVAVIDSPARQDRHYRLWCDGSYGAYLWSTLVEIATDLGGGAVGLDSVSL